MTTKVPVFHERIGYTHVYDVLTCFIDEKYKIRLAIKSLSCGEYRWDIVDCKTNWPIGGSTVDTTDMIEEIMELSEEELFQKSCCTTLPCDLNRLQKLLRGIDEIAKSGKYSSRSIVID